MSAIDAVPVGNSHPGLDYSAVKQRQQATWASGDFSVVAARTVYQAEQLCETAELQAGWRVLDVATGSGNAALAAARRCCDAVGIDYLPTLLERIFKSLLFDQETNHGSPPVLNFVRSGWLARIIE